MSEPLSTLLERACAGQPTLPAPQLDTVRERARKLRRARRGLAAGAAALSLVAVVGGARVLALGGKARTAPPVVRPDGSTPDGFLLEQDLRAPGLGIDGRWTRDQDSPVRQVRFEMVPCTGPTRSQAPVFVQGSGHERVFRYAAGDGLTGEARETILTLDAAVVRQVTEQFRVSASCPLGNFRLAATDSMLITGDRNPTVSGRMMRGPVGIADARSLHGRTFVMTTLVFTRDRIVTTLPGQPDWIVQVAVTAEQRATGSRPAAPVPDADARRAGEVARHGLPPVDPPPGFLTLADLGTVGAWTTEVEDTRTWDSRTPTLTVTLPACPPAKPPAFAWVGRTTAQTYWALERTASQGWRLDETVVTVRSSDRQAVLDALSREAACGAITTSQLGRMTLHRSGDGTLVVVRRSADGDLEAAEGWALSGQRLVRLTGLGDPGLSMPAGIDWFTGLLRTAARRAVG